MYSIAEVGMWILIASTMGFTIGYTVGLKEGKREGFIRGKIAARRSLELR
jgi:hypothetical protein